MKAAFSVAIAAVLLIASGAAAEQAPRIQLRNAPAGVSLPVLVKEVKPRYTAAALDKNVKGSITLHALVQADGRVGRVDIVRPLDSTVDVEAVDAIERWQFKPALLDGQPIDAFVEIELAIGPENQTVVYRTGADVMAPVLLHERKPSYTDDAMRAKVEGIVELDAVILPDGTPTDIRVTRSLYPTLDDSAIAALRTWKFRPARKKDGQPVAVVVTVEMSFKLKQ